MLRCLCLVLLVLLSASPVCAGPVKVGVVFDWQRTLVGEGVSGSVFVQLPLDRFAAPRRARIAESPHSAFAQTPTDAAEPAPEPPPPTATPAPPRSLPLTTLTSSLARRLVQRALRVRGEARAAERLDGLASRSRSAAVLPELSLRAVRSTDESLRLSPSGTYVNDYTQTGGAGLLLEARAVWKLDRLVFADDELRVEQLRADQQQASDRLISAVLKHLFAWQRARARLAETDLTPADRLRMEVEMLEAEAMLDVLTDGLFSKEQG